ncbi:hypothetical protein BB558_004567 [Smittium angustum]|uniref:Uncharacterized protein n=1 Tax=Smittium angustum TaxID=133377 RepID=A0A2U1J2W4_SMIAN|nr:hypothetical protein BB558_004567 [Smittium angustum]
MEMKYLMETTRLCLELEELLTEMFEGKRKGEDKAVVLLAELRQVNRKCNLETRELESKSKALKDKLEILCYDYTNYLGEMEYIEGEIRKVESIKNIYENVELIDVDEFMKNEGIGKDLGEHELMVSRMNYELESRKRLLEEKKALIAKKEGLLAKKKLREEYFQRLQNQVRTYVKSANILREALKSTAEASI